MVLLWIWAVPWVPGYGMWVHALIRGTVRRYVRSGYGWVRVLGAGTHMSMYRVHGSVHG